VVEGPAAANVWNAWATATRATWSRGYDFEGAYQQKHSAPGRAELARIGSRQIQRLAECSDFRADSVARGGRRARVV